MTKRTKRFVLILIAATISCSLAVTAYRFADNLRASNEVLHAKQEASAATSSSFTFVDARVWLEEHNYRVVVWNPHAPDGFIAQQVEDYAGGPGPRLTHLVVSGQRELRRGSVFIEKSWLVLTFEFDKDGNFEGVVGEKSRLSFW